MTDEEILAHADTIPGWMGREELKVLMRLARQARSWLEVGVYCGRSAYAVAMALPAGATLDLVDLWDNAVEAEKGYCPNPEWPREQFAEVFRTLRNTRCPEILLTATRASSALAATLPYFQRTFDVVFIDADHEEASVRQDIELWYPRCRLLCGHDWSPHWPGVVRAVTAMFPEGVTVYPGTALWAHRGGLVDVG